MTITISRQGEGQAPSLSFMQSEFWGSFKSEDSGWTSLSLFLSIQSEKLPAAIQFPLLLLIRRLPGGFSFAYIPHGPEVGEVQLQTAELLGALAEKLRGFLPRGCLFIRFDPPWYCVESIPDADANPESTGSFQRPRIGKPLREASAYVQVPDTVLVDLRPSEDEMLAAMKAKWRYNIRLAEKKGIEVREGGGESIPIFYELYRTTAQRDRIALHPQSYYKRLFALCEEQRGMGWPDLPQVKLWIASHEGQPLAAIITLFRGKKAVYLYGASSDEKRNLMPTYALQWRAMLAAKKEGCEEYDLFGLPPTNAEDHPMHGLYLFKTGFGGNIVHRAGSWDYPLSRLAYAAYRIAEKARVWYYKDFKKRLRRRKPSAAR